MDDLKKIIERNDLIRSTLSGCRLDISKGVMESGIVEKIIYEVKKYDSFDEHNDFEDEHNFGVIFLDDLHTVFWFIEYDKNINCGKLFNSEYAYNIQILLDYEL